MKRLSSRKTLVFLAGRLSYIVIVVGGIVSNIVSNDIRAFLARHGFTQSRTLIMFVGLIILGVVLDTWISKAQKSSVIESSTEKPKSEAQQLLDELKTRYKKRKAHKLDGRTEIPLLISEDSLDGVSDGLNQIRRKETVGSSGICDIIEQFEKRGRLLIIGSPGSGKTMLLLSLGEHLTAKAEDDDNNPLPIILNLDSWSEFYKTFDDWVSAMLTRGYGLSKEFARELLLNQRIVLLLDGLDELARNEPSEAAAQLRIQCLAALDRSLHDGTISVVICCRQEEYSAMLHSLRKLPTMPVLRVQQWDGPQIESALREASGTKKDRFAAPRLLAALHNEKTRLSDTYEKVLSTPFYLTTALQVFDSPTPPIMDTSDKQVFEASLVDAFFHKKLSVTPNPRHYSEEQTIVWLSWLAKFLCDNKQVTFELADLQPSCLRRKWQYRLLFGIVYAAIGWLVLNRSMIESERIVAIPLLAMIGTYILAQDIGLPILQRVLGWSLSRWRNIFLQASVASASFATLFLILGVWQTGFSKTQLIDKAIVTVISLISFPIGFGMFTVSGLIMRMSLDLMSVIFDKIVADKIATEDFATWNLSPLKTASAWLDISMQAFGFAVAAATVLGVAFAVYWIVSRLADKDAFSGGLMLGLLLIAFFTAGFICLGTVFGLVYGTIFGVLMGFIRACRKTARFAKILSPYQRLRSGITFNILQLFIVLAVMVFVPGLLLEFRSTVSSQAFFELAVPILAISSLGFFKTAVFKHSVLRVCLSLEGAMPIRYVRFLTYSTELRILEDDGGQWRFRHQILQDYFSRV